MATLPEIKETLQQAVLAAYQVEHKEYADNWRNIETKAQGNAAVTGIFIAGVVAFLTKGITLSDLDRVFIIFATLALALSIIFSILALRTRDVPVPPLGSFMDYTVKRLVLITDVVDFHERYQRFDEEHFNRWRIAMDKTAVGLRKKADQLWYAQVLLVSAILTFAITILVKAVS